MQKLTSRHWPNTGPTRLQARPWFVDRCRCYRHFGAKSRSLGVRQDEKERVIVPGPGVGTAWSRFLVSTHCFHFFSSVSRKFFVERARESTILVSLRFGSVPLCGLLWDGSSADLDAEHPLENDDNREEAEERAKEQQRGLAPERCLHFTRQELAVHVPDLHSVDRHH